MEGRIQRRRQLFRRGYDRFLLVSCRMCRLVELNSNNLNSWQLNDLADSSNWSSKQFFTSRCNKSKSYLHIIFCYSMFWVSYLITAHESWLAIDFNFGLLNLKSIVNCMHVCTAPDLSQIEQNPKHINTSSQILSDYIQRLRTMHMPPPQYHLFPAKCISSEDNYLSGNHSIMWYALPILCAKLSIIFGK